MQIKTPLLPGFHLPTLRRKPRSAAQKLAAERARIRAKSFSQLGECFGRFIPQHLLEPASIGPTSRRRLFSKANTFWGFFTQILDADGGCQEIVRRFQAFATQRDLPCPSSSTAAYCKARQRLPIQSLQQILRCTTDQLERTYPRQALFDRRVVVVDGTGLSMPDTAANQARWPQPASQKPGCGFPQARLSACFSLSTGALLSYRIGHKKSAELPLLRDQWQNLEAGDILLGDKAYCSYYDIAELHKRGIDTVCTLGIRKPTPRDQAVQLLGDNDWLVRWPLPKRTHKSAYSAQAHAQLPGSLLMRQIYVQVNTPGFRTQGFYLVTTLTDAERYPATQLAELYLQRWQVELHLRDLKTTLGMDILRSKTPAMVEKEILMHLIVYNSLRLLINEAAEQIEARPGQISFKAAQQALRQWQPLIDAASDQPTELKALRQQLVEVIAGKRLMQRAGRREPRAIKRRPRSKAILTRPRREYEDIPHRGRHRAKAA